MVDGHRGEEILFTSLSALLSSSARIPAHSRCANSGQRWKPISSNRAPRTGITGLLLCDGLVKVKTHSDATFLIAIDTAADSVHV